MGETGRKPLKTFRGYGPNGIQVAAWKQEKGISFSVTKRYKDKSSGEWRESKSFFPSDLLALAAIATDAARWASEYEQQERQQGKPANDERPAPELTEYEAMTFDDSDIPF